MTELTYLQDSYLQEQEAIITEIINEKFLVLNKTIFYAQGGGQPFDLGTITKENQIFNVLSVKKAEGKILHEIDKIGLKTGDKVFCKIDWQRRYTLMRMHSAAHLLSGILYKEGKILISGNQLNTDQSRIDFTLEDFDKEKLQEYFNKANTLIHQGANITISSLKREEALKNPEIVKLAAALPPEIPTLRIVTIEGIDTQADGGTHVHNIQEIKGLILLATENKGKTNRRIYFSLKN